MKQLFVPLALSSFLAACSATPPHSDRHEFGVVLMAHGGNDEWNRAVEEAVAPLVTEQPLEIAFGMADAVSLQEAVSRLEARGVKRVGVVRLFVSGESWYSRTRQILGLDPGAPQSSIVECSTLASEQESEHASHAHSGHSMAFWRVASEASFVLSQRGLLEEPSMGVVLAERAESLSRNPVAEDVLVLAHGPGDDGENERWMGHLEQFCETVRAARPFRRVAALTLREDWPEKRAEAERRIRAYVERARRENGVAIVIPFRVHGFGPYAEVLAGLEYTADGRGLLPHPAVSNWIRERVTELEPGPFEQVLVRP